MDIQSTSFNFPSVRGSGPLNLEKTLVFPRQVQNAVGILTGYSAQYTDGDHHYGRLQVTTDTLVNANTVTVKAIFGLRDASGDWDDSYTGAIDVTVLAELEPEGSRPRRTDLTIVAVETTQAIQHFRSGRHLNPGEGGPDNSIPLIAGKDTGLRLYIDFTPSATGTAFSQLSGEVVICPLHTSSWMTTNQ